MNGTFNNQLPVLKLIYNPQGYVHFVLLQYYVAGADRKFYSASVLIQKKGEGLFQQGFQPFE